MVFSFDQDLALAGTVTAVEGIEMIERELTQRLALGASDLGKAFSQLAGYIKTQNSRLLIVSDAQWFWPREVTGLQPDEEVVIFAEVDQGRPFEIEYSGKKISLAPEKTEPLLLKREWVKARLQKLLSEEKNAADKDMRNAFHNKIIKLSAESLC